jgi:fructoselysine-6-P-deglycase FrlB-like protein
MRTTFEKAQGFADVAKLIRHPSVKRVVASGNGASYYTAHVLWMAALCGKAAVDVVGLPAGLLCSGSFAWREGDLLLAVSSSGEFRDLRDAIDDPRRPRMPYAAITANPAASIPSGAAACAVNHVPKHRAVTHTMDFCGNTAIALSIWASVSGDQELAAAVAELPETYEKALRQTEQWASGDLAAIALPTNVVPFGTGPGWGAALQTALMVKEIAGVVSEGLEAREAATSAMTAAGAGHLFVDIKTQRDQIGPEALRLVKERGAKILQAPGADLTDVRLAAITSFPAAIALSVELANKTGTNIDKPGWIDLYYTTARRSA